MFKKLCILLIFSKLNVTKLFNRQISYAQLSVHDIHYLKDVKVDYSNCTVIGDRGYISVQVQLDLFETANIRLEIPYRCNPKEWKPTFPAFAKARKRIETLFSQLCDQFMIIRDYAKNTDGLRKKHAKNCLVSRFRAVRRVCFVLFASSCGTAFRHCQNVTTLPAKSDYSTG